MKLRILTDMQLLLCVQVDKVNYFIVYPINEQVRDFA